MYNLPPELVRMVVQYDTDVRPLALLNKYYNYIATPMLYEAVALRGLRRLRAFSRTLLTGRPILRELVKSLQIIHVSSAVLDNPPYLKPAIKDLLMHTPKVTDLTLVLSRDLYRYLFEQSGFPFVLRRFCLESIPDLESGLVKFLETQTRIESIRILGGIGSLTFAGYQTGLISALDPHILPNLKEIEAMPTTITNLVPDRPVSRIFVAQESNRWDKVNGVLHAIKQPSTQLTHLSLTLEAELWRPCWETEILKFFEMLQPSKESMIELSLKISPMRLSLAYASLVLLLQSNSSPSHGFESLRNQLSKFCSLRRFRLECSPVLKGGFWDHSLPQEYCNAVPELSQFELWKESCHSLEEVTMFGVSLGGL